jgi:hypothetical protein
MQQICIKICLLIAICRFDVLDWVKFKRTVTEPKHGWQGAKPNSVGFVQSVPGRDNDELIVSFCSGEVRVLTSEIVKLIPLDRGQHVQLKGDVSEPRYDVCITATLIYECNVMAFLS